MKRDIIIGDIHGCFDELQRLLEAAGATDEDRVISAGDFVDRGPDSVRVWEFLRDRPNTATIMGNHERKHVRGTLSYSQEVVKLQFGARYDAFLAWAGALPYYLETDHCLIVHGGFDPDVPLEKQREEVLCSTMSGAKHLDRTLGGRDWAALYRGPKPVVFGHRVVGDEAVHWNERAWAIDTGACHGGYLTALITPGFELVRVKASGNHWSRERRKWERPVLEARPWSTYRFKKLERELETLESGRSKTGHAFALELRAWLRALDEQLPTLVERAMARCKALESQFEDKAFKQAVAREPVPGLLFSAATGSLDPATAKAQLPTPEAVENALTAFGITSHIVRPGRSLAATV